MAFVMVRGHVADFERWREGFARNAPRRRAAGLKSEHVLRDQADPNEMAIVFEVDDVSRARAYFESEESRASRQSQGVTREGIFLPID
jgi:hypothetical protein